MGGSLSAAHLFLPFKTMPIAYFRADGKYAISDRRLLQMHMPLLTLC